ncbi:hypothetical protein O3P69_017758 [Scylla paramamosain]|uniref:Ionotropic glutamate receptor L-glutamate and glycine-binding domain-containing protein n=1 Tax=Scylla paramamosain TaxID=85552 RepID=A0AAW0SF13_SCYPA
MRLAAPLCFPISVFCFPLLLEARLKNAGDSWDADAAATVRVASWMVVVVVVSDDPVFLAAFAQQTREGRLLVWATRLIVVSRRTLHRLHPLHQTLALTNSLLLLVDGAVGDEQKSVFTKELRSIRNTQAAPIPDIPSRRTASGFPEGSDVMVAMEENHSHLAVMEPDPKAPGGVRLQFEGFMINVLAYLAQGLNFSYTFRRPPDRAWGVKLRNGSFTGMVGQVHREDATFGIFYEVKKKEEQGRLKVLQRIDYDSILDEVIRQHKTEAVNIRHNISSASLHFHRAMITSMSEAGLYYNWAKVANSNSTSCERVPIKITISSTLSIRQCSAMLMVLAGGLVVGLAVLCLEVVVASVLGTDASPSCRIIILLGVEGGSEAAAVHCQTKPDM